MAFHYAIKIALAALLAGLIYFVGAQGCSPTMFFANTANQKDNYCELYPNREVCLSAPDCALDPLIPGCGEEDSEERDSEKYLPFIYRLSLGKVDMVFVIDNSSSMAKEHKNLARQFRYFLTDIKDVDYHIAVITTDISASPKNPVKNAPYQDGKFIAIGSRAFLTNENIGSRPSSQVIEDFQNAIVRQETLNCDSYSQSGGGASNPYDTWYKSDGDAESAPCPSSDERGTYAINLAVKRQEHHSFFRPGVHTMFVILSDEDVRSGWDYREQFKGEGYFEDTYELEELDEPSFLVENLFNFMPEKTFSFYPIIIQPRDRSCLQEQNRLRGRGQGTGRGYPGEEYHRLARASEDELRMKSGGMLLRGRSLSICDRNYGSQLSKVALYAHEIRVPLPCADPDHVFFYINNKKIRSSGYASNEERKYTAELSRIPLGALLEVEFMCEVGKIFPEALEEEY